MGGFNDLSSRVFNRLTVIERNGSDKRGHPRWLCVCECGAEKTVDSRHLLSGLTKSCGCLRREVSASNGRARAGKLTGPLSHLYDPTLTDEHRLATRNVVELRDWRKAVFARDDYICDLCGQRGGKLVAHHLNCWSKYPAERFDVGNGVTICESHHQIFHRSLGTRTPCTASDYYTFKDRLVFSQLT